jgi:hypothetical protein
MEYSINNLEDVRNELINNWENIDPIFIFPTPDGHNITGYSLEDVFDINFPHTQKVIQEIRNGDKTYHLRLFIYPPKTRTTFHKDIPEFRYVLPVTGNDLCLNYEILSNTTEQELITPEFFKINTKEDLENFNTKFLKDGNKIYKMRENFSNLIGPNSHAHLNFGDDVRIVIVFDYKNKLF